MEGDAIDMKELLDILNKVKPGIDYVNEKHLVSDELIDSLDVMTIVTEICDEFDVEILPTDVVPENFESVEAMWQLIMRLQGDVKEVIIATNSSLDGETTAMYISKLIKPTGIKVSRIASGVPVGGDLEYIDEVTLLRALEGRVEL